MSAANTAAAGPKKALFLIQAPQQGKKPSINEGGQMSMRAPGVQEAFINGTWALTGANNAPS
jgi:hypothetical protein